jgi:competence protein ComFC
MSIFDYLFPKRCVICKRGGSYLCENCFTHLSFDAKNLCLVCNKPTYNNLTHPACKTRFAIDGCFSALTYNKLTQKLIFSFKYKPYLTDIKTILTDLFYESLIQNENLVKLMANGEPARNASQASTCVVGGWLMVPIPLSKTKLRKRGYNQAEILAKSLSKRFFFPVENILKRVKDTKTQVGKSSVDRKLNIKDAFSLKNQKSKIKNQNIFLIDDVVTTGSTLKEAAKVLKRAGAKKVIGLTLARD